MPTLSFSYLIDLRVSDSVMLHTQVTHPGHEIEGMQEETRAQQEGEDVRPLKPKQISVLNKAEEGMEEEETL